MITITYDPAVYKLVPVEPDGDMYQAAGKIDDICFAGGNAHGASDDQIWGAMLAAVPDQLPGVVEHSGEPVAYRWRWTDKSGEQNPWQLNLTEPCVTPKGIAEHEPLYTHPAPSQPVLPEDVKLMEGAEQYDAAFDLACGQFFREHKRLPTPIEIFVIARRASEPSQPSAEALVQAALEAALDAVQNVEINCDASGAAIGSAERRIRALSAQQIIDSCKEKS